MAEAKGKVTFIGNVEQIKDKTKIGFAIKTDEQYPKDIYFECWGAIADVVKGLKVGTEVEVSFDVSSREYNGKYYTTAKAFKVFAKKGGSNAAGDAKDKFDMNNRGLPEGDLPFAKPNMKVKEQFDI